MKKVCQIILILLFLVGCGGSNNNDEQPSASNSFKSIYSETNETNETNESNSLLESSETDTIIKQDKSLVARGGSSNEMEDTVISLVMISILDILQNNDYAITCDTLVLFGEYNEVSFTEKEIEFRYVNSSVNISIKTNLDEVTILCEPPARGFQ